MIWQAIAALLFENPRALAVPMRSIVEPEGEPLLIGIPYAARWVGLRVFDREMNLLMCTSYRLPFDANHSRYQNSREFMGILLFALVAHRHFKAPRGAVLCCRSDSMSALSWIAKNKASSQYAQLAFLAFTYVSLHTGFVFVGNDHIAGAGAEMGDSDKLSRDLATSGTDLARFVSTSCDALLNELFRLLDPTRDCTTARDLLDTFTSVARCIKRLMA